MLVVVWSALVINTIIEKGPIIFLKLAEGQIGQYDAIVYPTVTFDQGIEGYSNTAGIFVNFTQVQNLVAGKNYNLVPRK